MHDVPKESLGHHLRFAKDDEGWDGLDERLARKPPPPTFSPNPLIHREKPTQNTQDMSTTSKNPLRPPPNLRTRNHGTRMTPPTAGDVNPTTVLMEANHPATAPTNSSHPLPQTPLPTPPMEALSTATDQEHA